MPVRKFLVPAVVYLLINVLFVDKYTLRITEWHYLCDIVYLFLGIGLVFLTSWLSKRELPFRALLVCGGAVYVALMMFVQYRIDPMSLQVDRWSAISNFLDNLFHGIYPYAAQTHLGGYGSPFPVWQVLHIPFYALGNVGLSFFAVLILLLYTVAKTESPRIAVIMFLWIAVSPAINYEVAVRSDLFTNFMAVCALCLWLRYKRVSLNEHVCLIALIAGLCASTRLAAVIPLAFMYGYDFIRLGWLKQIVFIVVTLAVFALTFLPFLLWNTDQLLFFQYNPFVLQTRQGSPVSFVVFAVIAVSWTLYKKSDMQHFGLHVGSLLAILVIVTFAWNMFATGNCQLYSSAYDITYLNMSMPFWILEIGEYSANP